MESVSPIRQSLQAAGKPPEELSASIGLTMMVDQPGRSV
jgi:hypothetical protein